MLDPKSAPGMTCPSRVSLEPIAPADSSGHRTITRMHFAEPTRRMPFPITTEKLCGHRPGTRLPHRSIGLDHRGGPARKTSRPAPTAGVEAENRSDRERDPPGRSRRILERCHARSRRPFLKEPAHFPAGRVRSRLSLSVGMIRHGGTRPQRKRHDFGAKGLRPQGSIARVGSLLVSNEFFLCVLWATVGTVPLPLLCLGLT